MNSSNEARNQAYRLLATRNHSRHHLRLKLLRRHSLPVVEEVLEQLEDEGYLDDAGFAEERALQGRLHKCWGDRRIVRDLQSRGISAKIIDRVVRRVNAQKNEAESLNELIQKWIRRRGQPQKAAQLKGLFDHCRRQGYSSGKIRELLATFFEDLDWR